MGIINYAGRIGKVLKHEIDKAVELISETRKGYNQKTVLFNSSGEDSPPVKDDKIILLRIDGAGKCVGVGVFNESQGANPGEKIFFARDQEGNIVSKIKMLNNGDYIFDNNSETTGDATGNYTIDIKGDDSKTVRGNRSKKIYKNNTLFIKGDDCKTVEGDKTLNIEGACTIKVKGTVTLHSDSEVNVTSPKINLN